MGVLVMGSAPLPAIVLYLAGDSNGDDEAAGATFEFRLRRLLKSPRH
jgi:hypothetical protein